MREELWVRRAGVDDSGLCLQGLFHLPLERPLLAALSGAQASSRGARTRAEVHAEGESRLWRHQGTGEQQGLSLNRVGVRRTWQCRTFTRLIPDLRNARSRHGGNCRGETPGRL